MRYNQLGRTGLFVSELTLGTMTFGGDDRFRVIGEVQQRDADALVKRALEAGINMIDTADIYSGGLSETITGTSLKNLGIKRSDVPVRTVSIRYRYARRRHGSTARTIENVHHKMVVRRALKSGASRAFQDLCQRGGPLSRRPCRSTA